MCFRTDHVEYIADGNDLDENEGECRFSQAVAKTQEQQANESLITKVITQVSQWIV